jgi:hypothetical protein
MENSRYKEFIEGYNKGVSPLFEEMSVGFFKRTSPDLEFIVKTIDDSKNPTLKIKMEHMATLGSNVNEPNLKNYEKLKMAGEILSDSAAELFSGSTDVSIRKSAANIANSFFDVAKRLEDESLIKSAIRISELASKKS